MRWLEQLSSQAMICESLQLPEFKPSIVSVNAVVCHDEAFTTDSAGLKSWHKLWASMALYAMALWWN